MSALSIIQGTLTPRAPFDFHKTLQFVGDFTPTAGEQSITPDTITKAITPCLVLFPENSGYLRLPLVKR